MKDESNHTSYSRLDYLLQADPIIAFEYFSHVRGSRFTVPERRLMLAVLEDALRCYQKNMLVKRGHKKRLFKEAEKWIWENNREWPYSFVNITDEIGLDPQWIRSRLIICKQTKTREYEWICLLRHKRAGQVKRLFQNRRLSYLQAYR